MSAPATIAASGPGKIAISIIASIKSHITSSNSLRDYSKSRKHSLLWAMRPTIERLRALFTYDPETGDLYRGGRKLRCTPDKATGYLQTSVDYYRVRLHIVCWALKTGAWPEHEIDHWDQDHANNRWVNLREADHAQNGWNRGKTKRNLSGFKGVRRHKNGVTWGFRLMVRGVEIYRGGYKTKEEAAEGYRKAAEKYHGAFARTE